MDKAKLRPLLCIGLLALVTAVLVAGCGRGRSRSGPEQRLEASLPPTLTPVSVADVVPTFTSTPGHTPTPQAAAPTTVPATDTPVPLSEAIAFRVKGQSNVRSGPGTTYGIVGSQQEGDTVRPVARTRDGQWLELGPGRWIFASLVEGAFGDLPISSNFRAAPIAESAPAATPTPVADPIQTTPLPTPAPVGDLILAAVSEVQIKIDVEVRSGPDTTSDIVVKLQAGDTVQPVAQTDDGQWLELAPGAWIPSSSVEGPVADLPVATPTPVPAPTALPAGTFRVKADAEVRSGPDTTYDIVETLQAGETVQPVTQASDGQWLELGAGKWIPSSSVEGPVADLPVATPTPVPAPTEPTPTPTTEPEPTVLATYDEDTIEELFDAIWDDEIDTVIQLLNDFVFPDFLYEGKSALYYAVENESPNAFDALLGHADVNPNVANGNGVTPLFQAVSFGLREYVKKLLDHSDTDPNAYAGTIHASVLSRPHDSLKMLLNHPDIDPNQQSSRSGRTPLHMAVQYTSTSAVKLLLAHPDIDPSIEDSDGYTPLEWARFLEYRDEIVELLEEYGVE